MLAQIQRPLLILDLDETLIHARETPPGMEQSGHFAVFSYTVWERPALTTFLNTVSAWFDLAIWTASTLPYAQAIVERIIPPAVPLVFLWTRTECTWRLERERGGYYWLKNLNKVKRRVGYRLEQMLILDDSPRKLTRHYGNLLRVRPFTGQPADTELADILPYLDWLRTVDDMRTIDKRPWRSRTGQ